MEEHHFDPLETRVSGTPIRDLRQIAYRARAMLKHRLAAEVQEAQSQIADWRQAAFNVELGSAIEAETERLRRLALYDGDEDALRFFTIEGKRYEPDVRFNRGMEKEFEDMPTIDDRTRLEWVLEMIEAGLPLEVEALQQWTDSEFLAAHALALIEEAEMDLRRAAEPDDDDLKVLALTTKLSNAARVLRRAQRQPDIHVQSLPEVWVRSAFSLALEALDAVAKAELRRSVSAADELKRLLSGKVSSAQKEAVAEREKRKTAARAALDQRHAKAREHRAMVLFEWDKDRTKFASAERAGDFFADWLEDKGFVYQQRTVRDWIRTHAKKKGVVFR